MIWDLLRRLAHEVGWQTNPEPQLRLPRASLTFYTSES